MNAVITILTILIFNQKERIKIQFMLRAKDFTEDILSKNGMIKEFNKEIIN